MEIKENSMFGFIIQRNFCLSLNKPKRTLISNNEVNAILDTRTTYTETVKGN